MRCPVRAIRGYLINVIFEAYLMNVSNVRLRRMSSLDDMLFEACITYAPTPHTTLGTPMYAAHIYIVDDMLFEAYLINVIHDVSHQCDIGHCDMRRISR